MRTRSLAARLMADNAFSRGANAASMAGSRERVILHTADIALGLT
jgi:hypothetical protein